MGDGIAIREKLELALAYFIVFGLGTLEFIGLPIIRVEKWWQQRKIGN